MFTCIFQLTPLRATGVFIGACAVIVDVTRTMAVRLSASFFLFWVMSVCCTYNITEAIEGAVISYWICSHDMPVERLNKVLNFMCEAMEQNACNLTWKAWNKIAQKINENKSLNCLPGPSEAGRNQNQPIKTENKKSKIY